MSSKRGRPVLETDDVELQRRRAQNTERRRIFYTHHRAERAERVV